MRTGGEWWGGGKWEEGDGKEGKEGKRKGGMGREGRSPPQIFDKFTPMIMKCLKCAFFLIASLQNLSLCVMILILQLT